MHTPEFKAKLRSKQLFVPEAIADCTGIRIFGKTIRSVLFSTDVSIICNSNADAVIAVYPFTPQSIITQAIMTAAHIPVFAGVGGGTTSGERIVNIAIHAEHQGAIGVVLNAPTTHADLAAVRKEVEIPIVITVVREDDDIEARIAAGADILNVSGAAKTPEIVRAIRKNHPDIAIIATGGHTDESIRLTIEAGANAITWTPPTSAELFKDLMEKYRELD